MRWTFFAVAVLAVASLGVPANSWAQLAPLDSGMVLMAEASADSQVVSISGHTIKQEAVLFSIWSPLKNLVKVDQVQPSEDGTFAAVFNVSGLKEDGAYTIVANQGNSDLYELSVSVSVVDGVAVDAVAVESNFERAFSAVGSDLFQGGAIELVADAMEGSDTIHISGQTDSTNQDVTLTVTAPNGNVISVDQIDAGPAGGLFSADIIIGGPLWSQDGAYTVTAEQDLSGYATSVSVDVQDGLVVPEFGTIAALVLAASIVSIVAFSAKSGLSLAPRF